MRYIIGIFNLVTCKKWILLSVAKEDRKTNELHIVIQSKGISINTCHSLADSLHELAETAHVQNRNVEAAKELISKK